MLFAQEAEVNLRAVLHTIDYSLEELASLLNEGEQRRFRSFEKFIDKATVGALRQKAQASGLRLPEEAWKALQEACEKRNELAHHYLEQLPLPPPSDQHHEAILSDLKAHAVVQYQSMMITRTARDKIEGLSNERHERLECLMDGIGVGREGINRGLWENREHLNQG